MTGIRGPKWLRRAWVAAMLLTLPGAYVSTLGGNTEGFALIAIGGSIALTFPSGLLLSLVGYYAAMDIIRWIGLGTLQHLPVVVATPMGFLLIALWETSMIAAGYLQWFWLVPKLYSGARDSLREGVRWRGKTREEGKAAD